MNPASVSTTGFLVLGLSVIAAVALAKSINLYRRTGNAILVFSLAGALLGGLAGYLLRPSLPFVGQLPLSIVLTRGLMLEGFNTLLRGAAELSFNYMLIGAVLVGTLGAVIGVRKSAAFLNSPPPVPTKQCRKCGHLLAPAATYCTGCGDRATAAVA